MEGYQMFTIFVPKKSKVAAVDKKPTEIVPEKTAEKPAAAKKAPKKEPAKAKAEPKDDDEIF